MNKGELVKAIGEKAGLSQKDAGAAFDALTVIIAETLKKNEKIQLAGFGTFELKERQERMGINPLTKEKVKIAATKAPSLKFGKAYKDLFN